MASVLDNIELFKEKEELLKHKDYEIEKKKQMKKDIEQVSYLASNKNNPEKITLLKMINVDIDAVPKKPYHNNFFRLSSIYRKSVDRNVFDPSLLSSYLNPFPFSRKKKTVKPESQAPKKTLVINEPTEKLKQTETNDKPEQSDTGDTPIKSDTSVKNKTNKWKILRTALPDIVDESKANDPKEKLKLIFGVNPDKTILNLSPPPRGEYSMTTLQELTEPSKSLTIDQTLTMTTDQTTEKDDINDETKEEIPVREKLIVISRKEKPSKPKELEHYNPADETTTELIESEPTFLHSEKTGSTSTDSNTMYGIKSINSEPMKQNIYLVEQNLISSDDGQSMMSDLPATNVDFLQLERTKSPPLVESDILQERNGLTPMQEGKKESIDHDTIHSPSKKLSGESENLMTKEVQSLQTIDNELETVAPNDEQGSETNSLDAAKGENTNENAKTYDFLTTSSVQLNLRSKVMVDYLQSSYTYSKSNYMSPYSDQKQNKKICASSKSSNSYSSEKTQLPPLIHRNKLIKSKMKRNTNNRAIEPRMKYCDLNLENPTFSSSRFKRNSIFNVEGEDCGTHNFSKSFSAFSRGSSEKVFQTKALSSCNSSSSQFASHQENEIMHPTSNALNQNKLLPKIQTKNTLTTAIKGKLYDFTIENSEKSNEQSLKDTDKVSSKSVNKYRSIEFENDDFALVDENLNKNNNYDDLTDEERKLIDNLTFSYKVIVEENDYRPMQYNNSQQPSDFSENKNIFASRKSIAKEENSLNFTDIVNLSIFFEKAAKRNEEEASIAINKDLKDLKTVFKANAQSGFKIKGLNQKITSRRLIKTTGLYNPTSASKKCTICRKDGKWVCLDCRTVTYCSFKHRKKDQFHPIICVYLQNLYKHDVFICGKLERESSIFRKRVLKEDMVEHVVQLSLKSFYTHEYTQAITTLRQVLDHVSDEFGPYSICNITVLVILIEIVINVNIRDAMLYLQSAYSSFELLQEYILTQNEMNMFLTKAPRKPFSTELPPDIEPRLLKRMIKNKVEKRTKSKGSDNFTHSTEPVVNSSRKSIKSIASTQAKPSDKATGSEKLSSLDMSSIDHRISMDLLHVQVISPSQTPSLRTNINNNNENYEDLAAANNENKDYSSDNECYKLDVFETIDNETSLSKNSKSTVLKTQCNKLTDFSLNQSRSYLENTNNNNIDNSPADMSGKIGSFKYRQETDVSSQLETVSKTTQSSRSRAKKSKIHKHDVTEKFTITRSLLYRASALVNMKQGEFQAAIRDASESLYLVSMVHGMRDIRTGQALHLLSKLFKAQGHFEIHQSMESHVLDIIIDAICEYLIDTLNAENKLVESGVGILMKTHVHHTKMPFLFQGIAKITLEEIYRATHGTIRKANFALACFGLACMYYMAFKYDLALVLLESVAFTREDALSKVQQDVMVILRKKCSKNILKNRK